MNKYLTAALLCLPLAGFAAPLKTNCMMFLECPMGSHADYSMEVCGCVKDLTCEQKRAAGKHVKCLTIDGKEVEAHMICGGTSDPKDFKCGWYYRCEDGTCGGKLDE